MFPFTQIERLLFVSLVFLAGCITTARFDQHVYVQTTSVKVDAISLMDLAAEDYTMHKQEVKQVIISVEKVYEYERNRKNNEITIKLWDKLLDTSGHLLGGFVKRWRNEGQLKPFFIQESKKEVGEAFDIIAQLESKKIKPKQLQN